MAGFHGHHEHGRLQCRSSEPQYSSLFFLPSWLYWSPCWLSLRRNTHLWPYVSSNGHRGCEPVDVHRTCPWRAIFAPPSRLTPCSSVHVYASSSQIRHSWLDNIFRISSASIRRAKRICKCLRCSAVGLRPFHASPVTDDIYPLFRVGKNVMQFV